MCWSVGGYECKNTLWPATSDQYSTFTCITHNSSCRHTLCHSPYYTQSNIFINSCHEIKTKRKRTNEEPLISQKPKFRQINFRYDEVWGVLHPESNTMRHQHKLTVSKIKRRNGQSDHGFETTTNYHFVLSQRCCTCVTVAWRHRRYRIDVIECCDFQHSHPKTQNQIKWDLSAKWLYHMRCSY